MYYLQSFKVNFITAYYKLTMHALSRVEIGLTIIIKAILFLPP